MNGRRGTMPRKVEVFAEGRWQETDTSDLEFARRHFSHEKPARYVDGVLRHIRGMEQWHPDAPPALRHDVSAIDCADFGKKLVAASAEYRSKALENAERASRLAAERGALRTERDELLRENAVLRRRVERLERKVKR